MKSLLESILSKRVVNPDSIIAVELTQKMGEMGCESDKNFQMRVVSVDSSVKTLTISGASYITAAFINHCALMGLNNINIESSHPVTLTWSRGVKLQNINIHSNCKLYLYFNDAVLNKCLISAPQVSVYECQHMCCVNCVWNVSLQLYIELFEQNQVPFDKCTIKCPFIVLSEYYDTQPVFKQHLADLGLLGKFELKTHKTKFEAPTPLDERYDFTLQDILSPVFINFKWKNSASGIIEFEFGHYANVAGTSLEEKYLTISKQKLSSSKTSDNYYINIKD